MRKEIENKLIGLGWEVLKQRNAMLGYWDQQLICCYANEAYSYWFGKNPEEMIGKIKIDELLGPQLFEKNLPYIKGALAGKVQVFERNIELPNGEIKTSLATYSPDIENGNVIGFLVHVADITTIKNNLQEELIDNIKHVSNIEKVVKTLRSNLLIGFPGIDKLAKIHNLSATKLKADFKKQYNHSIFSYYRFLQMEFAHNYFTKNDCSKKEMAAMLNFANPSNFSLSYSKYLKELNYNSKVRQIEKAFEERYHTLIDQAPQSIVMVNNDLQILAVSSKWLKSFCNTNNPNIIGENLVDVCSLNLNYFNTDFKNALSGKSTDNENYFSSVSHGELYLRWHVNPWYNNSKEIGGLILWIEDITEVKKHQLENQRLVEIMSKTNEIAKIGAWERDLETGLGYWSKILKEILEVPDNFSGTMDESLNFCSNPYFRDIMVNCINLAIDQAKQFDEVVEITTYLGNHKIVRVIGYPEIKNGKCIKLSGIFQEIALIEASYK